jgi:hypothetical protein
MPYIKQFERKKIDTHVDNLFYALWDGTDLNRGALNYSITRLVHLYIKKKGITYSNLSDVTGVLTDVLAEFNRSVVAPYEDKKMLENGDIGILEQ